MIVCLVSQEYPPETAHGGIAVQTQRKAEALAALGHDVHVLSHAVEFREGDQTSPDGIRVRRIAGPEVDGPVRSEPFRWLGWSVRVARELERLDEALGFDLIEFPDYGAEGYAYLLNRDSSARPAVVVHAQGPLAMLARTIGWPADGDDLYRVGRHMEKLAVELADAVYASSRCGAGWITSEYGVEVSDVLHSGIDIERFVPVPAPTEPAADPLVVLFVGRVAESKGVFDLAEAAGSASERAGRLVLRFAGAADDALKQQIRERTGKRVDVEFLGPVANHDLPGTYQGAHVFASPSHYESGPGFTFLEAMASGLPVIGPAGSGIDETVRDGKDGFLVPPRDVGAIARALELLVSEADLRHEMGRNARERAVSTADQTRCGAAIAAYFERVVATNPRRSN